jgi:hypothetical protein
MLAGIKARPSSRGGILFQEEADAILQISTGLGFTQRFAVLNYSGYSRQQGGLAALSYFEMVIDGEKGNLWLKQRATPAIREDLNTSGILFYAARNEAGNKLEVLEGSPAWNLGLRSQDSILTVDGKKST